MQFVLFLAFFFPFFHLLSVPDIFLGLSEQHILAQTRLAQMSGFYICFALHLAILVCKWSQLATAHLCLFQIFQETGNQIFALIFVRKFFRAFLISKPGINYYGVQGRLWWLIGNLPSLKFTEIHKSVELCQNLENKNYFGDQCVL